MISFILKCTQNTGLPWTPEQQNQDISIFLYISVLYTIQTWDHLKHCPRQNKLTDHVPDIHLEDFFTQGE